MDRSEANHTSYLYAGALVIVALTIGGATFQGIWSDHLIEIAMIPAMLVGFYHFAANRLGTGARTLIVIALALIVLQFLPVSRTWSVAGAVNSVETKLFSPAPLNSLEGALFIIPLIGFMLFISRFTDHQMEGLFRFVSVGVWINVAVGFLQLSFSGKLGEDNLLPYRLGIGLFSNENHFSTLIFASIPLFAWRFLARTANPLLYIATVLIFLLVLFATGSKAGMALSGFISVLAFVWFSNRKITPRLRLLAVCLTLLACSVLAGLFLSFSPVDGDRRMEIFSNTFVAIKDYWFSGSGLGTFQLVYPMYERTQEIAYEYAARAHNDYLQIFLELGIVGIGSICVLGALLVMKFDRSELAQAAMLSLITVAIHSLVDFPMRTFGIAVPVAYLIAVILSEPAADDVGGQTEQLQVDVENHRPQAGQLSRLLS